ncbi:transmembrane protein 70, mitochondrial [Neoarius graeffei]|uniref:transmembrane protein 70, mitochondrial n=1 Tax=Neoarius graeffei TaxID=443677 RepID=UPI00298D32AD|nr:transmembrane protein 70, mitochondrial [Neoarius graeffei]
MTLTFLKMFYLNTFSRFRIISVNQQILGHIQRGNAYFSSSCQRTCTSSALNNKQQQHLLRFLQRRTCSTPSSKQVRPCVHGRCYSSQTGGTEDGVLIYTGSLGKAVLGVKFFSYSSSMFSLCAMPLIFMKTGLGVSSFVMKAAFCGFIGFFTFLTPVLLHLITKGYVVRMYHNKETDTYTAVTYSALLLEKKSVFHQSDVKVPDVSRMFTSFYAKKQSLLINPMLFDIPHDYNHLMGYDKPFSFDPEDLNKPDKN